MMPAADGLTDERRIGEAELGDGVQRLRLIFNAGEDEAAHRIGETAFLIAKELVIDVGYDASALDQRFIECRQRFKAGERGDVGAYRIGRNAVGLRVLQHLDAVLNLAGRKRKPAQRIAPLPRWRLPRPALKGFQSVASAALVAAAKDELLRLGEEFDVADTTAAELDVEDQLAEFGALWAERIWRLME